MVNPVPARRNPSPAPTLLPRDIQVIENELAGSIERGKITEVLVAIRQSEKGRKSPAAYGQRKPGSKLREFQR